ncbi:hypothetical protein RLIN73S_04106 [Rhodanobacter lindaniclasticus]
MPLNNATREDWLATYGPRETMEYDVVVVGAGPGGLATAIRLKQLAAETGREVSVCVLEKGSEPGAHILSGAIMDPRALTELFPDWAERGAPLVQAVTRDEFLFLDQAGARATLHAFLPECFHNQGNYIISLGALTRWLARQAEALGVEIFPGFAAAEILYTEAGAVRGVATGNMGLGKDGEPTAEFQLGMELHAKYTMFAEGSRGQLGRQLIARYALDHGRDPQAYGLGIKELWQAAPGKHQPGLVVHTAGWPLDADTYGGSFLYHAEDGKIAIGLVVGLDYKNPWLSPFDEFQRFKTHPAIRQHLEGGTRIGYGARSITAGGLLSLPRLVFPGGALVGCEAGTLNASRIKGSHAAIKTGMLAAEATFAALGEGRAQDELIAYPAAFEASWLHAELRQSREFQAVVQEGPPPGHPDDRGRAVAAAQAGYPHPAVDLAPRHSGSCLPGAGQPACPDRLSQARRRACFRPPQFGVPVQHEPRREPAGASDLEGPLGTGGGEPGHLRRTGDAVLPGRRVRVRGRAGRPAPADQRSELRALQDLRHQGPDPEHRVGGAPGWRPQLQQHVSRGLHEAQAGAHIALCTKIGLAPGETAPRARRPPNRARGSP